MKTRGKKLYPWLLTWDVEWEDEERKKERWHTLDQLHDGLGGLEAAIRDYPGIKKTLSFELWAALVIFNVSWIYARGDT